MVTSSTANAGTTTASAESSQSVQPTPPSPKATQAAPPSPKAPQSPSPQQTQPPPVDNEQAARAAAEAEARRQQLIAQQEAIQSKLNEAQQEAAKKQAEERAKQLKAQQDAARKQAEERAQQLKQQQQQAQQNAQKVQQAQPQQTQPQQNQAKPGQPQAQQSQQAVRQPQAPQQQGQAQRPQPQQPQQNQPKPGQPQQTQQTQPKPVQQQAQQAKPGTQPVTQPGAPGSGQRPQGGPQTQPAKPGQQPGSVQQPAVAQKAQPQTPQRPTPGVQQQTQQAGRAQPQAPQRPAQAQQQSRGGSQPPTLPSLSQPQYQTLLSHHQFNNYSRMGAQGEQPEERASVPRHPVIDDSAWQVQRRVPQENIQQVNPGRINVPEFQDLGEIKPTVIVPQPAESTKVKWNEFPEEEEKEPGQVPRVRAQEWVPENEVEHVVVKTNYQPSRIARQWPPPGYGEDEEIEMGRAMATKTMSDEAWRQQNENAENEVDEQGKTSVTTWRTQVSGGGEIRNRQWPPPENVLEPDSISGSKLAVQWPPTESEDKEQQDVQSIQTHLPVKAGVTNARPWPPVQPGTEVANDVEAH
ncbi:hypothetical protein Ddc_08575 [Ditylenchus destructor]|nr:hypothetical protein Ddc_08575 [Ditylenchus destructor]